MFSSFYSFAKWAISNLSSANMCALNLGMCKFWWGFRVLFFPLFFHCPWDEWQCKVSTQEILVKPVSIQNDLLSSFDEKKLFEMNAEKGAVAYFPLQCVIFHPSITNLQYIISLFCLSYLSREMLLCKFFFSLFFCDFFFSHDISIDCLIVSKTRIIFLLNDSCNQLFLIPFLCLFLNFERNITSD